MAGHGEAHTTLAGQEEGATRAPGDHDFPEFYESYI